MPDESTKLTREETNLRKFIRRCIESPKEPQFFSALKAALYFSAPLNVFDQIRILDGDGDDKSLFERQMYTYTGARNRQAYIAWCVKWVSRMARLTAMAKPLIPVIEKQCSTAPALLYNLDKYEGPEESGALMVWASEWARRAEEHTILFLAWYENPAYQESVRAGVWDILRGCGNLGGTTYKGGDWHEGFVDALCFDAWRSIMTSMDRLTQPSDKPIEARLRGKAQATVHRWKSDCLRDRARHITDDRYIRLADSQQLADEDEFTLSILTYAKGVSESDDDKEKRLKREAKSVPAPQRRCVKCDAVLASWNQSEQSICVPCWQSSQPDYIPEPIPESGFALLG